jgi:hypothetical protein
LQHIKGVGNHLADILSRNPAGLGGDEILELTKPNTISVKKIDLKTDKSVLQSLKGLADKQRQDPRLRSVREKVEDDPANNKYRIERDLLFSRNRREPT